MEKKLDILFIHPSRMFNDYFVPMGLIGLINSVKVNKKGIFLNSVTKKQIRNSKLIVMDLHWYYQIYPIDVLSRLIRKINPSIKIIVGGYTATILAESLIKELDIDYVLKGDAEGVFSKLIMRLLKGEGDLKDIPNLLGKNFRSRNSYILDKKGYNQNDCMNIEWFDDLKKVNKGYHEAMVRCKELPGDPIYPLIPVFKGCIYNCEWCYGSPMLQKKICGRGQILRDPEYIARDLRYCSKNKDVHCVYIISDFIELMSESELKRIFNKFYHVDVYYEFYNIPTLKKLKLLLDSFRFKYLRFSLYLNHAENKKLNISEQLLSILKFLKDRKDCSVCIFTNLKRKKDFLFNSYLELYYNVKIKDNSQWNIPVPLPSDNLMEIKKQYHRFYNLSKLKTQKSIINDVIRKLS